ncbi:MAG: DNA polymerase III subunit delta [Lachnospiraceae bacterium]
MKQLNEDLKTKNFKSVYLLYGEEGFLRKSYKNRFLNEIAGDDDMNCNIFEGSGIELREVREIADTMPFFAERRLVILEYTGLFQSASEEWVRWLDTVPDTTCVLFVENTVDKRTKLFKKVRDKGYCVELGRQNPDQLKRWIIGLGKQNKMVVTLQAAEALLECCGDDMECIKNELDKVMAYAMDQQGVTPKEVWEICSESTENRIFEMIDLVAKGKAQQVLELYYDLVALKEPPMRILFLLARQFNQLMQVRELTASGMGKDNIASKMKLRPFVVGKLMNQARVFSFDQLKSWVILCVDFEEQVKTGFLNDRIAVEMLLVQISKACM